MSGCQLIVHADDFGLSEKINEGILLAHLHGILTSASIVACGRAFEHAVEICQRRPTLDVGVHLTLVEETPLLDAASVFSLVDEHGNFHRDAAAFTRRHLLGRISLSQVLRELDAQIRRVLDCGLHVSHLDSHQHLHVLPGVRKIVAELAKTYGIRALRRPCERPRSYMVRRSRKFRRLLEMNVLAALCSREASRELWMTDTFVGFYFGGNLTKENLLTVLEHLPSSGTCELMCHPGMDDTNSRYRHWDYHPGAELEALTSREARECAQATNARLESFRSLN